MTCIAVVNPSEIPPMKRERRARRPRGKVEIAYVCYDRSGDWTLLSQKLPILTEYINTNLADEWGKVSTTGLYEAVDRTSGRVGGWHKGRWRVKMVPLVEAKAAFEAARREHRFAAVLSGA